MNIEESIMEAYHSLVIEKKTPNISIIKICQKAGISRKTFYNHFSDRYDLVKHIMVEEIIKPIKISQQASYSCEEMMRLLFTNLQIRKDYYSVVVLEENQNSLFDSLVGAIQEIIQDVPKNNLTDVEAEYVNYRGAVAIASVIKKWIAGGMKESPETMSKVVTYKL